MPAISVTLAQADLPEGGSSVRPEVVPDWPERGFDKLHLKAPHKEKWCRLKIIATKRLRNR